jgi:hypothetical protein
MAQASRQFIALLMISAAVVSLFSGCVHARPLHGELCPASGMPLLLLLCLLAGTAFNKHWHFHEVACNYTTVDMAVQSFLCSQLAGKPDTVFGLRQAP